MGAAAGTTMGYGSAPKRDTGGESVQEFMASHLIGSTDSPPPRSASVAECRTWSHGSQRMGLDANVSRKRLFGTRHDFGSGRAEEQHFAAWRPYVSDNDFTALCTSQTPRYASAG